MQRRITVETSSSVDTAEHEPLSNHMLPQFLAAYSDKMNSEIARFVRVFTYNKKTRSAEFNGAEQ